MSLFNVYVRALLLFKGVLPLVMNDLSVGFNNRRDITLDQDYEAMCGFKKGDIQRGLDIIYRNKNGINTHLQYMEDHYDGYKFSQFGEGGIYNSNLCLDYLQNLLTGKPIQLVGTNNELGPGIMKFIDNRTGSAMLLSEL